MKKYTKPGFIFALLLFFLLIGPILFIWAVMGCKQFS